MNDKAYSEHFILTTHQVFKSNMFLKFAEEVQATIDTEEAPSHILLQRAVPLLTSKIDDLIKMVTRQHQQTRANISEFKKGIEKKIEDVDINQNLKNQTIT
jgi:hypothetical protein